MPTRGVQLPLTTSPFYLDNLLENLLKKALNDG